MRCALRLITLLLSILSFQNYAHGQIDTTQTAKYLVEEILLGSGVLTGNVTFTGEKHAIGLYNDSTNQLGIEQGIVLTSGNAYYVLGPNKTPRSGWASNAPGDEELDKIARGKTYDASVLEFDFVTHSEQVSFEFVFASEEYLEYVGSKFNDVFAFFLTDPEGEKTNIAKLPDGITPITVNTVNHKMNANFYVDNAYTNVTDPFIWDVRNRKVITNENYLQEEQPPKYFTQFDGFTTVLKAQATVIPNKVYHIKIAIADVGDGILDSGVFLKAGSFSSSGQQVVKVDNHFESENTTKAVERLKKKSITYPKANETVIKIKPSTQSAIIEFDFDKASLSEAAYSEIENVFATWSKNSIQKLEITGHTDNYGSDGYNIDLSKRRAQVVAQALQTLGIPKTHLIVEYYGEKQPLKNNNSDFGRARNRRVEIKILH
ncbi:OmpA family protein [Fulvivirga sp. RKSG066]|uniref:OmpA family protein n=1 Tax=Fulvivirga aurantia TaxID=2529383 RepID=UPI0012BD4E5F|nr:OmpA family protein [Fulvivirga aurantia]MTI21340.1 OmpA family protein [Fulvivirga aurantia]